MVSVFPPKYDPITKNVDQARVKTETASRLIPLVLKIPFVLG